MCEFVSLFFFNPEYRNTAKFGMTSPLTFSAQYIEKNNAGRNFKIIIEKVKFHTSLHTHYNLTIVGLKHFNLHDTLK